MRNYESADGFPLMWAKLLRFLSNRLIFPRQTPITQSGTLKPIQSSEACNEHQPSCGRTYRDRQGRHLAPYAVEDHAAVGYRADEPLSPNAIRAIQHSEECPIGRWLVSQHTSGLRNTPEYRDLVAGHEEFHREVAQIAAMINHGKYSAARRALDPNSSFRQASQAMASAIMALDRIQSIAIAS